MMLRRPWRGRDTGCLRSDAVDGSAIDQRARRGLREGPRPRGCSWRCSRGGDLGEMPRLHRGRLRFVACKSSEGDWRDTRQRSVSVIEG